MSHYSPNDPACKTPRREIPPEALEVIADAFLASSGRDDDYPAYDENRIGRKGRQAARAEEYFVNLRATEVSDEFDADYLFEVAGLSQEERAALKMYAAGYRPAEIGRLMRIPRPTVMRILRTAGRRLQACRSGFAGLGDVYRREVHKRIY